MLLVVVVLVVVVGVWTDSCQADVVFVVVVVVARRNTWEMSVALETSRLLCRSVAHAFADSRHY